MRLIVNILAIITLFSCSTHTEQSTINISLNEHNGILWNIDTNDLIGEFKPFPLIDSLRFETITSYNLAHDNHRAIILPVDDLNLAFLFHDVSFFEVLNFNYNNKQYVISHCPITNTTLAFNIPEDEHLRASGFRYRDNLVMYNSTSNSFISQMLEKTIGGNDASFTSIPLVDTKWSTLIDFYPNSKIAYVDDLASNAVNCDINCSSQQSPDWDNMSVGLNNNTIKSEISVFNFKNNTSDNIIYNNGNSTIIGIKSKHIVRVFNTNSLSNFTINNDKTYFIDANKNKYNWNGYCFEGPKIGSKLATANSYLGSSFSFDMVFNQTHLIN